MNCKRCNGTGWIGNQLCICKTIFMKWFPILLILLFTQCEEKGVQKAYAKQNLIKLIRENQEKFTKEEANFLLISYVPEQEMGSVLRLCTRKWSTSKTPCFNKYVLFMRLDNGHNDELIQQIQRNGY